MMSDHGMASNFQTCPFNPCLTYRDSELTSADHNSLFHQDCDICTTNPLDNGLLCLSCQHLRLRHLLLCVPQKNWFYIVLGTIREIFQRPQCAFCRLLAQLIIRNRDSASREWKTEIVDDNECILRQTAFFDLSESKIHLQISLVSREALIENRGRVNFGIHVQVRFQDLQIRNPVEDDDDDDEPSPLYNCAVSEFGLTKSSGFEMIQRVEPRVDWIRIKHLLKSCQDKHTHIATEITSQEFSGPQRVIDIERGCVVRTPAKCRYLALSYVWGNTSNETLRATKDSIRLLEREGSLSDKAIPLTILDAMEVCVQLEEKWLWVDRLCIIQDDAEEKRREIEFMGEIYKSACTIIVAAAGESADAGLPGVSSVLRPIAQLVESFSNMEVAEVLPSLGEVVDGSVWNTRGWTYQERLLSPRTLFFTRTQVFYHCDSQIFYEDSCGEGYVESLDPAPFRTRPMSRWNPYMQFTDRLEVYSARSLSHESDIFDAFTGVGSELYHHSTRWLFGLPEWNFDQALLWQPDGAYSLRLPDREMVLPSWSWASHGGSIKMSLCNSEDFAGSFIQFHVYSEKEQRFSKLNPIPYLYECWSSQKSRMHTSSPIEHDRALYLAIAWKQGCATSPSTVFKNDNGLLAFLKERTRQQFRLSNDPSFRNEGDNLFQFQDVDDFPLWAQILARRPGSLLFRAPTALFSLHDYSPANFDGVFAKIKDSATLLTIVNKRGHQAGFIEMGHDWVECNLGNAPPSTATFKFIAVSIGRASRQKWPISRQVAFSRLSSSDTPPDSQRTISLRKIGNIAFSADPAQDIRYFDQERNEIQEPLIVNVMLVRRTTDVWSRLGVGWVYLARWHDAEPFVQTFVLG